METREFKWGIRLIVAPALCLATLLLLCSAPIVALAHAKVAGSSPADGASVPAGLTQATINFTEELSVDQSTAELSGPGGAAVSGMTAAVDRADRKKLTLQFSALQEGKYTIKWKAVTEDDNGITNGTISFTVAAGASTQGTGSSTPTATTTGATSPGPMPQTGAPSDFSLLAAALIGALILVASGIIMRRRAIR
ncbi:MAG: copper resistance protein CopC [Chloroflexota bacterium]|nr:copper resistance protein CopC [Chloroflexota bacterium]